ncbi:MULTISPECIES: hypothetical protein [unclassified Paenibacillus]
MIRRGPSGTEQLTESFYPKRLGDQSDKGRAGCKHFSYLSNTLPWS